MILNSNQAGPPHHPTPFNPPSPARQPKDPSLQDTKTFFSAHFPPRCISALVVSWSEGDIKNILADYREGAQIETLTPSTFHPACAFFPPSRVWWMLRIFQGRTSNCLPRGLTLTSLSNGLCIGGTYMVNNSQHYWTWPCLSFRGWPLSSYSAGKGATGMSRCLCPSPHWVFSILSTPLLFALPSSFSRHSGTQSHSPHITVSIYDRGKNQYNTKQWLIGLRVQCAERSLLYIMYGSQLMVSVLADKWTLSISPVWWSHRGDVKTHTHTNTNKHNNL